MFLCVWVFEDYQILASTCCCLMRQLDTRQVAADCKHIAVDNADAVSMVAVVVATVGLAWQRQLSTQSAAENVVDNAD